LIGKSYHTAVIGYIGFDGLQEKRFFPVG